MTGLNENDVELNPPVTYTNTVNSPQTSVTVFGVNIDLSQMQSAQNGDQWSYGFNAEGMKSSDQAFVGNGTNALKLAEVKDDVLTYGNSQTNVQTFYQGMIGTLGDNASQANRMVGVSGILKDSADQTRMSNSSVSLDEEMTNMIQYQHGYNAAARVITMMDEMLDKIINGMGSGR